MNNKTMQEVASTASFPSEFLLTNVGAPFVIGLAVGYFSKKMLRVALLLGGVAIVLYSSANIMGLFFCPAINSGRLSMKPLGG